MQVEQYLTDIINKMRGELREITDRSVKAYPTKARDEWIFDWPSQIILVVNQIYWCLEVEEAFQKLEKGQKNSMQVGHCAALSKRPSHELSLDNQVLSLGTMSGLAGDPQAFLSSMPGSQLFLQLSSATSLAQDQLACRRMSLHRQGACHKTIHDSRSSKNSLLLG